MSPTVYTVLTEFRFEVGSALVNSEKVQRAVDGISQSADNALNSLRGLGLGFIANFGLGATTVIGTLMEALKASDSFTKSQLAFSNIMSSNLSNLTGDINTFNDRMMVSSRILKDIAKDAQKFGLPEQDLTSITKTLAATLVPKGLAGPNFKEARNMGRNLLKSAPILNVDPGQVQGELMNLIGDQGAASQQNTLFRRLSTETKAFRDVLGGAHSAAQKFNALPLQKRFELLRDGLGQFAKDTDVLAGNAQTLSAMMQRIRDLFVGLNGILIPLGNAIRGPLIMAFESIFQMLNTNGRRAIEEFSAIFKLFVSNIETAAINLSQAKKFGKDFKGAGETLGIAVIIEWLIHLGILKALITLIVQPMKLLIANLGFVLRVLGVVGRVLIYVGSAIARFTLAMLPLLVLFQTISRAEAIGRLTDLKALPAVFAQLSEAWRNFVELMMIVFGPALQLLDQVAGSMAWIFEFSYWLQYIVSAFKLLTDIFVTIFAIIRGFVWAVAQTIQNIAAGKILSAFSGFSSMFREGRDSFFDEYLRRTQKQDGNTNTTGNVTNINKVEINNQFKEQLEPDRIAFALTDQLKRISMNPQGAVGRSRDRGLVSR